MRGKLCFFGLTLLIGCCGGVIGKRIKLPAGYLVGSMIAVATFNLLTNKGIFCQQFLVCLQIFSGAMIGARIGLRELKDMKKLLVPMIILLISLVLLNLSFAFCMIKFSNLDAATALFACAPGGMNDMSIIAADFGGNPGVVAILQVSRIILIYLFMPPMIRWIDKRAVKKAVSTQAIQGKSGVFSESTVALVRKESVTVIGTSKRDLMLLLLASALGGLILYFLGVSAGALIGGMLGGGVFCVVRGRQKYPVKIKMFLQMFSGAYIGMKITRELLMNFHELLIPMLIIMVGIFAFTLAGSTLMCKFSKIDKCTAMLSSTPGGIAEMSLLSEELEADTASVAVLHTGRLFFVILLFPYMIQVLLYFIS